MARYLSRESEPYGKWKGIPIYLTTILCAVMVGGLFLSAFLISARSPLLQLLTFSMPMDDWTSLGSVLTYPLIDRISFFTPFSILCFYWFAIGIESHLGRGPLTRLLLLLLATPVAVGCIGWWVMGIPSGYHGMFLLMCSTLIAFATLYPNAEWLGWIPFKWVAFACFICGSLMEVSEHQWMNVAALWGSCLVAFLYMRHAIEQEYDDREPFMARVREFFRPKPKFRILPPPPAKVRAQIRRDIPAAEQGDLDSDVDTLLDKIARSGLSSLTDKERAKLERAREELLKKDSAK